MHLFSSARGGAAQYFLEVLQDTYPSWDAAEQPALVYDGNLPDGWSGSALIIHPTGVLSALGVPDAAPSDSPQIFRVRGMRVPALYLAAAALPGEPILRAETGEVLATRTVDAGGRDCIHTVIDLVAGMVFLLGGWDERLSTERDGYDRFPSDASWLVRNGFLGVPVVAAYMSLLAEWLALLTGTSGRDADFWPGGAPFAVVISHDVDALRKYDAAAVKQRLRATATAGQARGDAIRAFVRAIKGYLSSADPYWNVDEILDAEDRFGFNSSWYMLCARTSNYDARYELLSPRIRRLMQELRARGREVGVHGSFNTYLWPERLAAERERLKVAAGEARSGGRQHYLRFRVPDTWDAYTRAGLAYDSTLGFAGQEGFRTGLCYPYRPPGSDDLMPATLWELPLMVMDGTLRDYRKLKPADAWDAIMDMVSATRTFNGVLTMLWHNSFLDREDYPEWWDLWLQTLQYLERTGAYRPSGIELITWWEGRRSYGLEA